MTNGITESIVPDKVSRNLEVNRESKSEALLWAEAKIKRLNVYKSRDEKGALEIHSSTPGGLRNSAQRLPLAGFLADISDLYKDRMEMEEISAIFLQAMSSLGEYSQETKPRDVRDEILRMSRSMIRMCASGGFESGSRAYSDYTFVAHEIEKMLYRDPERKSREEPLNVEAFRSSVLPMQKFVNHIFASHTFNHRVFAAADADHVNLYLQERWQDHHYDGKRIGSLVHFILDIKKEIENRSSNPKSAPSAEQTDRVKQLYERLQKLSKKWGQDVIGAIAFASPGIEDKKNQEVYGPYDLIDTTLELLEDQLDFIERNADTIHSKYIADEEEVKRDETENARRDHRARIEPELKAIARLETDIAAANERIERLTAISKELSDFSRARREGYFAMENKMKDIKVPFFALSKQTKYVAALQEAAQITPADIRTLKRTLADFAAAAQASENITARASIPVREVIVTGTKGSFQPSLEDKERERVLTRKNADALNKTLSSLKQSVYAEIESAGAWLDLASELSSITSSQIPRDFEKHFSERISAISAKAAKLLTKEK